MHTLNFSMPPQFYYGLELHAGPIGRDVYRHFVHETLCRSMSEVGIALKSSQPPSDYAISHYPPADGKLIIQIVVDEPQYQGLCRVFRKLTGQALNGTRASHGERLVEWALDREGLARVEADNPVCTRVEKGTVYQLNADRAIFVSVEMIDQLTGVAMTVPPLALPIN